MTTAQAQREYAERRYVLMRALLTPAEAASLAARHDDREDWHSYPGHDSCSPAPEVLTFIEGVADRVFDIVGYKGGYRSDSWVNRYGIGGYIVRHSDRRRDDERAAITILNVCLVAPPHENGGELMLATQGGEVGIHLESGDALIFDGTRIEHWTIPLVATAAEPAPVRMVAVGRYYPLP